MKDDPTYWDSKAPAKDAKVEEIEHFDARGMRHVYGRRPFRPPSLLPYGHIEDL